MTAERKTTRLSRAKRSVRQAMTKSEDAPGKKKRGRPPGSKKKEEIDLAYLKQEMLLPEVEKQVEQRHRVAVAGVKELTVPYTPNKHQQELHDLIRSHRYGVVVVHRGFGKTYLALNELIRRAWECTAVGGGLFGYIAPEKLQAKYVAWSKLKLFVQNLPVEIHEADLSITFPNGSILRLYGADNPHRIRGQHFHYLVLDEVGQMPRDTWHEACYPALQANDGGALFIGTPKGDNFFKEVYDSAAEKRNWFQYLKTVRETSVFTEEQIENFHLEQGSELFAQEYLCSFDAASSGTYYAHLIAELRLVTEVAYDPTHPVITGWDLGTADDTVIWFVQQVGNKIHVIDYYESNNKDFLHYLAVITSKPYVYSYHILPHDVNNRSWETGKSRLDYCKQHNMRVVVAPKTHPSEGIAVVQSYLYRCAFDLTRCEVGIRRLMQYHSKRDKYSGRETGEPAHDGNEHCADAFRTLIMGLKNPQYGQLLYEQQTSLFGSRRQKEVEADYDYFN